MKSGLDIKERARKLRRRGKSFGEIQNIIGLKISKSTLSDWCKDIPLPAAYQKRLEKINYINLRKGRDLAIKRALEERKEFEQSSRNKNKHLLKKIDEDAGKLLLSALYLGEGAKRPGLLMLGNSNVNIIKLFLRLLEFCYGVGKERIKCRISYRKDQDINKLTKYWSREIGIPIQNFYKTIPDPRTNKQRTRKKDYMGVCVVHVLQSSAIHVELEIISEILILGL